MTTVGFRLRSERERLNLTQDELANYGHVVRNAQANYEKDARHPNSKYLEGIAKAGVDVLYVLTGNRSVSALPYENVKKWPTHNITEQRAEYTLDNAKKELSVTDYNELIENTCKELNLNIPIKLGFMLQSMLNKGIITVCEMKETLQIFADQKKDVEKQVQAIYDRQILDVETKYDQLLIEHTKLQVQYDMLLNSKPEQKKRTTTNVPQKKIA